jgi:hypothetical protein
MSVSWKSDGDVRAEWDLRQKGWNEEGEYRLELLWRACREALRGRGSEKLESYPNYDSISKDDTELWQSALQRYKGARMFRGDLFDLYPDLVKQGTHILGSLEYMDSLGIVPDYFVPPTCGGPLNQFTSQLLVDYTHGDATYEIAYLLPIAKRIAARKIARFILHRFGSTWGLHHHMNRPHGPVAKREFARAMAGHIQ